MSISIPGDGSRTDSVGGLAVVAFGIRGGVRLGLGASVLMAGVTLFVVARVRIPVVSDKTPITLRHVWATFPVQFRWLLASDIFIRTCDAAAKIAERTGKKPFVIATFVAFALFPLTVVSARGFASLVVAFVVGGLREVGEPARKALIIDLAQPALRARVVGMYYLGRSLAIAPAAFIGGLLWRVSPGIPFYVAAVFGGIGVIVFAATVREEYAV